LAPKPVFTGKERGFLMRFLVPTGMMMLAMAFLPLAATGANPGSGSKGSGSMGSGSMGSGSMGSGSMGSNQYPNSQNYKWRNDYPWYGGYYPRYGYGYGYGGSPYIVERPILENPLPGANFSGSPIRIVNPASSRANLSYTLNGVAYTIQPGESQDLREDRAWVIEFNRGGSFGQARYGLQTGMYSFSVTDHGWELYRGPLEQTSGGPPNPPPPSRSAPVTPQPTP
jgi:hypothetical protein